MGFGHGRAGKVTVLASTQEKLPALSLLCLSLNLVLHRFYVNFNVFLGWKECMKVFLRNVWNETGSHLSGIEILLDTSSGQELLQERDRCKESSKGIAQERGYELVSFTTVWPARQMPRCGKQGAFLEGKSTTAFSFLSEYTNAD